MGTRHYPEDAQNEIEKLENKIWVLESEITDLVDSGDIIVEEMKLKIKHLEDENKWLRSNTRADLI